VSLWTFACSTGSMMTRIRMVTPPRGP